MDITISAKLLEKEVEIDGEVRSVYGLAALHTSPRNRGLGRLMMKWVEEKAKEDGKHCVVGFVMPATFKGFNAKCGWYDCGMYEERVLTTSKPVKSIVVNERW